MGDNKKLGQNLNISDVIGSFILEYKKKYHRFWKMIYWNYHPHNYFSDGFVKHYNKLKELEPDKWS
jgi:hypothetical protein